MIPLFMIVFGGVFVALGGAAYGGLWRSWARNTSNSVILGLFWFGLAALAIGVSGALANVVGVLALVFGLVAVMATVLGILVLLNGAPRWLQPRWYRVAREG
ncbi:hypothetical protein EDF24_3427 [Curtobacterium sp. PhB130]|uniref:hypothetical protein n=1 Tax=unclassified Curtobacterium TaxID=257496 RepID=UPI000F4B52D8|nr:MULTISPECIES: hypothetical protein [unclassified Curtobacterium]ROS72167.1 hypothetical protein EDF24_3427 [Curtobacterium sp. PhB130]TCK63146.1 hypothetical protein EDF27_2812 [Curtobacterium sp. PhB136]